MISTYRTDIGIISSLKIADVIKIFNRRQYRHDKLIEKAFKIGGTTFYQFTDIIDMPYKRFLACRRFANEVNMGVSASVLKDSLQACIDAVDAGKFTEVVKTLMILKEKADMAFSLDASYRLCSAVYFYKDEPVDDYDYTINEKKIELFKAEKLDSFFLQQPARDLLTGIDLLSSDLQNYLMVEKELDTKLSETLKTMKSNKGQTTI
jgi:hypothetical protein